MNGQEMIDFTRTICGGLSDSQLTDIDAVKFMNIGYHKVKREIVNLKEDYFWGILKADTTVVGQSEYEIPSGLTGNFDDVSKVMSISVKYGANSDFVKAEKVYQYELDKDLSFYETNQPQSEPFFFIADNSYFIYPAPQEAVVNGIKVFSIKDLIDIDENTTEENIFAGKIPTDYHYIVPFYMRFLYYMSRGVDFKADKNEAKKDFDVALQEITDGLGQRDMSIIFKK